ncbi:aldo/keto reductase [Neisseria perflava]|uniref:aldo/keto reductase n=1 Tax=Neisseria perflava TaxID=33053 RepID=UPI0020A106F6|nr:aldo/keto reductase [Neisseria perflava]MCP1660685.1 aryl-alcohol dehydrogenase-like predicted oxidoreductase [Neisseria perflava]MCP1771867.1 aryl-alcohol dehydrogenase-like predicted oxidoreductase [Neisseria perflava]
MNPTSRRRFLQGSVAVAAAAALPARSLFAAPVRPKSKAAVKSSFLSDRNIGGLTVSAIGLGCQNAGVGSSSYGSFAEPKYLEKMIRQAADTGVTFFDTAKVYGEAFESEKRTGAALKPIRQQVVIASKFGMNVDLQTGKRLGGMNSRPEQVRASIERMLKTLQTDYLDLVYQHRVDPAVPIEDVAGVIKDMMKEGKVLHWGLSEAGADTIRRAHREQPLAAVQNEYSLLYRGVEREILPLCEELGIGLVAWSPLGMGFLTGAIDENRRFAQEPIFDFRAVTPRFAPENLAKNMALVRLIQKWAMRKQCTAAQLSLSWLTAQKPFIVPIPGTTKVRHMLENTGADDVAWTADELTAFRKELDQIQIAGERLPKAVLDGTNVNAPRKR